MQKKQYQTSFLRCLILFLRDASEFKLDALEFKLDALEFLTFQTML